MTYFVVLFLIAYLFLSIKRHDWSVFVLLLLLPTYQIRFSVFGIPSTLLEAMILISFSVWFIGNYKKIFENLKLKFDSKTKDQNTGIKRYPFDIEIAFFLVISFIALGVAGWSNSAFGIFKAYVFEPLLLYILLFNTLFLKKDFSKIFWPLTISAFLVSVVAVLQKFGLVYSPENFLPRVTGVFVYPNALGLYLGPIIMLMIGWLSSAITKKAEERSGTKRYDDPRKNKKMSFVIISVALSLIALFLASSEGAIVGVFAALFIFVLVLTTKNYKKLRYLPHVTTGIIFLFVITSPLFFLKVVPEYSYPDFANGNLNKVYDKLTLKDFSGEVRKQQWRETFSMMKDEGRWFWGVGPSGYRQAVKPYHQEGIFFNFERDADFRRKLVLFDEEYKAKHWHPVEIYMYPHNFILNFWVEFGLLGAILFAWIFRKASCMAIANIQSKSQKISLISLGLLGALVVMMVHGMVDVPFFKNDLVVMFWVFVAMIGFLNMLDKKAV